MATLYSTGYGSVSQVGTSSGAVSASTSYIYKGPAVSRRGEVCVRRFTYDLANGAISSTNTSLKVAGGFVAGEKCLRISISSGDDDLDSDNNLTVDIGFTGQTTAIASAATILQAGAETSYGTEELEEITLSTGDEFILTRAAGDSNSSGTLYFVIESTLP